MQDNLRFFAYAVFGVFAIWFLMMVSDIYIFMHTDVDDLVSGTAPIMHTDIGDRCGSEYVNSSTTVDYKLSKEGQIIYLCPPGISPIRSKVTAIALTETFRHSLPPAQQIKIAQFYPVVAAPIPVQQTVLATPATENPNAAPTAAAPVPVAPAPAPAMSSSPPPVESTSPITKAPAEPANQ